MKRDKLNDQMLLDEALIKEALGEAENTEEDLNSDSFIPDSVISEITPWRASMDTLLIGLALSMVTLNILGLNYILPAIGFLMTFFGFRSLRNENSWFRLGWIVSIPLMILFYPGLAINMTIYAGSFAVSDLAKISEYAAIVLRLIQLYALYRGLRSVYQKTGREGRAGEAKALIVWYLILIALAMINWEGIIVPIIMVVVYVLLIKCLFETSRELEEAGYAIEAAPVRFEDGTIAIAVLCLTIAGMIVAHIAFSSYPMEWSPAETTRNGETEEICAELVELGFPENVLDDMADSDIVQLKGADHVFTSTDTLGKDLGETSPMRDLTVNNVEVYKRSETGSDLDDEYYIIHHFSWNGSVRFRGTECIGILPPVRFDSSGYTKKDISGRLLYDSGDSTMTADFYRVTGWYSRQQDREQYGDGFGMFGQIQPDLCEMDFSIPDKGSNQRGYVMMSICPDEPYEERLSYDSVFEYYHQTNSLMYPVKTAREYMESGEWSLGEGPFINDYSAFFVPVVEEEIE